jgi:FlaA1/EpsC-like NDP-sugar epimerase
VSFPATPNPENSGRQTPPGRALGSQARARKLQSINSDTAAVPASAEVLSWNRWQERVPRSGEQNVLIVGAGRLGRELAAILQRDRIHGRRVVGFVDERQSVGGDVLGRVDDLARIARSEFVDEVILAIPDQHYREG